MNTIREEVTSLYEIERSSFYGILAPIQSEEEAKKIAYWNTKELLG